MGETSRVRSNGSDLTSVLESSIVDIHTQRYSNTLADEATIGLKLLVQAFNDYTMNAIEPATTLSLTRPELIDWNPNASSEVLTFQNDYALAYYLNTVKPVTSSTNEQGINMNEADIEYLSHKIKKKKNRRSDGENHLVAVSEPKRVKTKDVSKGENLFEVPEDEIFDALPNHF